MPCNRAGGTPLVCREECTRHLQCFDFTSLTTSTWTIGSRALHGSNLHWLLQQHDDAQRSEAHIAEVLVNKRAVYMQSGLADDWHSQPPSNAMKYRNSKLIRLLQLAHLNREQRDALLRSKRTRVDPAIAAEVPGLTVGEAAAALQAAFQVSPAAVLRAVRQVRQCVSGAVRSPPVP